MPRRLLAAATLAVALLTSACLKGTNEPGEFTDPTEVTYASSLAIDLATFTRTGTGLYVKEGTQGAGTAAAGTDSVGITYTVYLTNGSVFDASATSGPTPFRLSRTIPGFAEGVTGMRVGGTRRLVVPPQLGYGREALINNTGRTILAGNSVLVFDVRLDRIFPAS